MQLTFDDSVIPRLRVLGTLVDASLTVQRDSEGALLLTEVGVDGPIGTTRFGPTFSELDLSAVHGAGAEVLWQVPGGWPAGRVTGSAAPDRISVSAAPATAGVVFLGLGGDDWLTGGLGSDMLDGGEGDDTLDGAGGNDTLIGGAGNDTYWLDSYDDRVIEAADGGDDIIFSTAPCLMASGVEQLVLLGTAGINGSGNALGNRMTGNSGDNRLRGLDGDDTLDGGAGTDRLEGGRGDDLFIVDQDDLVVEAENAGRDTVESAASHILMPNIEVLRLTGTAAVAGVGNDLDNVIYGNGAANLLDGGAGADTLIGGAGNDTYEADAADTIIEVAGGGLDTLRASADAILPDWVEVLVLAGTGPMSGTGNAQDNRIEGNEDDNTLTGGAGADTLIGGYGNDLYLLGAGDVGDQLIEVPDAGIDTVQAAFSATLGAHLENLRLTGTAALSGGGNALDNRIWGNSGANTLIGGLGSDTMDGGAGADVYQADGADMVFDSGTDGAEDTVYCTGSMDLGAGIEVLVLTGSAGSTGRGNGLSNRISGNNAANLLDGMAGADTLIGGLGDDIYISDGRDTIHEAANGGRDRVFSTGSITLTPFVEEVFLTGTAAISATGNGEANLMVGNVAGNWLTGLGGADTLMGGLGNDVYVIDRSDTVVEGPGEGYDTVRADFTRALPPHIEVLLLTGTAAIDGTGNDLPNVIWGNAAANRLNGGAGADTLSGGAGADIYMCDGLDIVRELAGGGIDEIQTTASRALPAWVEHLTAIGSVGLILTGNDLANRITGGAGDDRLEGRGGADTLIGGGGNDTYIIGPGDVIKEVAGGGAGDRIVSATSTVLPDGVEHLRLTGSAGLAGTGNIAANLIEGNAGANRLDGRGGVDTLVGGAGNDTYISDGRDLIVERPGQGIDTVYSSGSWGMTAAIENLMLTGTAAQGRGNDLANLIAGNAAANLLEGGGGNDTLRGWEGADRLIGGRGDDILFGGAGADRFVLSYGGGRDQIRDFQNGLDRIEVDSGAERFTDLHMRQSGAHVLVEFAGASVLLWETRVAAIDPGDFIFT